MDLSITAAIEEIDIIQREYELVLTDSQQTALEYAKAALQTIEDGNFILKGINDNV